MGDLVTRFNDLLAAGAQELFEDNRDRMHSGRLIATPNEIAPGDCELFFDGLDTGLIDLERGARFNTQDRPRPGGRWALLSRSREGGWFNAEYLPQIAAYVDAINNLRYPSERVLFELPQRALQLDLAILDDEAHVIVLGEAKRSSAMLRALIHDVAMRFGDGPPEPETKKRGDEARQLAWRLWTVRPPLLWMIAPDTRRAFACGYKPFRRIELDELPRAAAAKLAHKPGARLEAPSLLT